MNFRYFPYTYVLWLLPYDHDTFHLSPIAAVCPAWKLRISAEIWAAALIVALKSFFGPQDSKTPEKMATKLATCGSISSPICRTSGQNWGNSWGKTRWQFWLFWLSSKLMNLSIYFSISVVYFHFHPTFWNVMLVHIAPVHRRPCEKECRRHMLTRTKSRWAPTAACILKASQGGTVAQLRTWNSWENSTPQLTEWLNAAKNQDTKP